MTSSEAFFKSICAVSRAFGTTLGTDELLDLIVRSAADTMKTKAASLYLKDEKKDEVIPVSRIGLSETYAQKGRTGAAKLTRFLEKDGCINSRDAQNDPRFDHHEAKKAEKIASILIVPVMVKNEMIGMLAVFSEEPRDFTEDEIQFLCALAEQGGMAIQYARLLERAEANANLFLDLAANINSSLDIKKVLHILTADIAEALNMLGVTIRLFNRDKGTLDLVASYGLSESFLEKGPVRADKSVGKIALEGETVVIEDVRKDKRVQYPKEMAAEKIVSMICLPVSSADEIIGVMSLYGDTAQTYSESRLTFIRALAHQGGLAIRKAYMYLTLMEEKECLREEDKSRWWWF